MSTTANDLLELLAYRHAADVFVPECKDGPSQGSYHQRLDAWAMKKSWRHPLCVGYEIKVSRGDFLKDDKWRGYLPYCNEFYFVCPPKLILAEEVPADVGLLWSSANASRLYSKKKAAWRDVEIPDSIFRYVLFSRAKITREFVRETDKEYWTRWMADRKVDEEFGGNVSRKIREVVKARIRTVEQENCRLKERMDNYDVIQRWLEEQGIATDDGYFSEWDVKRKIEALRKAVPPGLLTTIAGARDELECAHAALSALNDGDENEGGAR